MNIIGAGMLVLMGVLGLVAVGYVLFGLYETIWSVGDEVKNELHLHDGHHIGTLAPHH